MFPQKRTTQLFLPTPEPAGVTFLSSLWGQIVPSPEPAFSAALDATAFTMPRASSRVAAAERAERGDVHPRPRGSAPPQYPIWDGALGNWVDTAGNARPITSRKERKREQKKERRRAAAVAFVSERDRNAERGREYVGLTIQIPWTAWGSGYETSAEYSTATVIEYKPETREGNSKKIVSRFHVAFDPELDYDDTHLSWDELLGKSPCRLGSRYAILDTQPGKPLGRRQPPGKRTTDFPQRYAPLNSPIGLLGGRASVQTP